MATLSQGSPFRPNLLNTMANLSQVKFRPNLLNTMVWLVETAQQISVFFVNYKGRPWMKGLLENQPLFISMFLAVAMVRRVCRKQNKNKNKNY
jgi:hypothetical protein